MNWTHLTEPEQVDAAIAAAQGKTVAFFKHSTRCSISKMSLLFLEDDWSDPQGLVSDWYFVDLIAHRPVSNRIAEALKEQHESPQLLLVRNGECIYEASHDEIRAEGIHAFLATGKA